MNTQRLVVLGVALVAACGAAFLVRGMLGGGTPQAAALPAAPPIAMTQVLVANADLQPGQALLASQVHWEKWPAASANANFITHDGSAQSVDDVVKGAVVRSAVLSGQPIAMTAIVHADASGFMAAMLSPGMRAMSITISTDTGAGGFILPNDRIDVILTRKVNEHGISRTVLSNVRVLAVDQTFKQEKDARTVMGKTATVEVTPEQAEMLSSAQSSGILSLALRPLGDTTAVATLADGRRKSGGGYDGPVAVFRYGQAAKADPQQERAQ
jgi:pilus assembly protein CpaB